MNPLRRIKHYIHTWKLAYEFIQISQNMGQRSPEQLEQLIRRIVKYEIDNEEKHILWKQAKISELQSQINPHFLYNTLESIRGQAIEDNNAKIAEMTEALAKYFRYSINKEDETVELKKEIENIANYIYIQKYRFEDRFQFVFELGDDEAVLQYKLPKMSLQPIVENAIFHGLENRISGGLITIRVERTQNKVYILIQDNGQGMDSQVLENLQNRLRISDGILERHELRFHMGIALLNVNQRLKLMFGEAYGLVITSAVNVGTEVLITIPTGEEI